MKRAAFILIVFICSSLMAFAQSDEVKTRLQNSYLQFLREEGFTPSVDEDGDVAFKKEGVQYYLRPTTNNKYFRLSKWVSNEDKLENLEIFKTMAATMREYRAVRVYPSTENTGIWVEVAIFLANEEDYKTVFYRSLDVVTDAYKYLIDSYNKE